MSSVDLEIGGMTCASCAARIEKKLNRMDGVTATVNYATEKARVAYEDGSGVGIGDIVATVEATGYTAALPAPRAGGEDLLPLEQRLLTAVVLAIPVIAMAMVPALQLCGWQWLSLILTTPVVGYAAWPFHRATWANLRHGTATMDTLISVGTLAAYGWSVWALFLGDAGTLGMKHPFELTVEHGAGSTGLYFEVAAGVTAFILAGRFFEARSKRRAGAALRALMELGAKDVAVLRDGREIRVPTGELAVGDLFVVRPGEKIATDGVVREGSRPSTRPC